MAAYSGGDLDVVEFANVPKIIGAIISHELRLASLHELGTVYGLEDAWDLIEVMTVCNHNKRMAYDAAQRTGGNSNEGH